MNIGLAYNCKSNNTETDEEAEFDSPQTIQTIRDALSQNGNKVHLLEADDEFITKLKQVRHKLDIVFNIAEGRRGSGRESFVPCVLEHFNIPYTGSNPLTLAITLNKARTKEVLEYHNIKTPKYTLVKYPFDGNLEQMVSIPFPLIVKPVGEGSSKGITNNSLVRTRAQLTSKVYELGKKYEQDILVEKYITGREFTVSILGNRNPRVLPIVELNFDALPRELERFDSYEAKWTYDSPQRNLPILKCPAQINKSLHKRIVSVCLSAYQVLDCRDFSRIDLRVDSHGNPQILDVNALAGLIPDPKENSRFPRAAREAGFTYTGLIQEILAQSLKRYNIAK